MASPVPPRSDDKRWASQVEPSPALDRGDVPTAGHAETLYNRDRLPPPPVSSPPNFETFVHEVFSHSTIPGQDNLPTVAGYEVFNVLGHGGMGVVYLAKQRGLNRLVALKMLQSRFVSDQSHTTRFRTEVEAIARLQHPNIVQVFEVGEHERRPFCALEYVPGGTLAQMCRDQLPPPRDAAALLATVAEAVHYAHERGVLHRDLKPSNVLVALGSGK